MTVRVRLWALLGATYLVQIALLAITSYTGICYPAEGPYVALGCAGLTALLFLGWYAVLGRPLDSAALFCPRDHLSCSPTACPWKPPASILHEIRTVCSTLATVTDLLHEVAPYLLPVVRQGITIDIPYAAPAPHSQTLTLLQMQLTPLVGDDFLRAFLSIVTGHGGYLVAATATAATAAWLHDDSELSGPQSPALSEDSEQPDAPQLRACRAALAALTKCPVNAVDLAIASGRGTLHAHHERPFQSLSVSGPVYETVQRLVSLNQALGTNLLVTQEVQAAVHHVLHCELMDCVDFHQETIPVREWIYEVPASKTARGPFERAFRAFVQQDAALARQLCSATTGGADQPHFQRLLKLLSLHDLGLLPEGYCRHWVGWEFSAADDDLDPDCFDTDSATGTTPINVDASEATDHLRRQLQRRRSNVMFNEPPPSDSRGSPAIPLPGSVVNSRGIQRRPTEPRPSGGGTGNSPLRRHPSGLGGRGGVIVKAHPNSHGPLPAPPNGTWTSALDDLASDQAASEGKAGSRGALQQPTQSSFESASEAGGVDVMRPVAAQFTDTQNRQWFVSGRRLGTGSFGTVYLGMNVSGALVAVKQMPVGNKLSEVEAMLKEIGLLSQLEHPNIVSYLGSQLVLNQVVIVMEFGSGGTLADIISDFNALEVSVVACYAFDILKGLRYLHSNQILHRDVKPLNVLVQRDGACKLADFGTAGRLEENFCVGTLYYMAPEAMQGQCDKGSDIWSFGVMLFQMLTMDLPFMALAGTNLISTAYTMRASRFELKDLGGLLPEAADMVTACLQVDLAARPSSKELLHHDFFMRFQADLNAHSAAADKLPAFRLSQLGMSTMSLGVRSNSPRSRTPSRAPGTPGFLGTQGSEILTDLEDP